MKVLFIRFSSIGDIVVTTPVLRCFKKKYADAELHYLTKTQFHSLIAANPHLSKIHLLDDKKKHGLSDLIEILKKEKYDLIVDLHKNLRSSAVKTSLGTKSVSFKKLNFKKWLKVNFKIDLLPEKQIVHRYFETLRPLGVENDGEGLDYYIWDNEVYDYVSTLVHSPYIAFAIGAKHSTKRLPDKKIIELCKGIHQKIFLLGGKEEEKLGAELNSLFPSKIVNLCGKLTINESALVIKNARKVISHDTGLMHIAAAFKKPLISIWGNTIPEFGFAPYYGERNQLLAEKNSHIFQVEDLPCRPCSKLGYPECPKGHFNCMNQQDIQSIVALANAS